MVKQKSILVLRIYILIKRLQSLLSAIYFSNDSEKLYSYMDIVTKIKQLW